MKRLILFTLTILLISSCSDDLTKPESLTAENLSIEKRDELKTTFGRALAGAIAESPSFRELLKEEAIKMFDNDYDILYHMIKGRKLKEGLTVRELMLRYFEEHEKLTEIENRVPLLTIFVPELPENTFSAKTWDPASQTPSVGITSYATNDVNIVDHTGTEFILKASDIPAFPVIVVKENERVTLATAAKSDAQGRTFSANNELDFVFLADCFDGSIKKDQTNARITLTPDAKLVDAYNIYYSADGWHRDYIYYDISPGQTRGPFSYDFSEHITTFKMMGDATAAYSKIADATADPKLKGLIKEPNSGWTGGYYEFKVRLLLNAKNGVGEELITYFSAVPDQLFDVAYVKWAFPWPILYNPTIIGTKTMDLSLPLFPWDLNSYASTIMIEIEEVDLTETIVNTTTRTVDFATNFGIEDGELLKIGLKFGASQKQTTTQTIQKTYTNGNDALGAVIVNFADNVITGSPSPPLWQTREYSTGWYSISVEPKRVQ